MNILGIETSCDETAAAVVRDGREVLSNVVYTQIPLHQPYGGVVPEIASRAHVEKISKVVNTAIAKFRETAPGGRIDEVAVTYGPGLSPALIVGLNAAKGIAMSLGVPLVAINHIEAHLHTPFLRDAGDPAPAALAPESAMPAVGLAISGGHTVWFDMPEYGVYRTLGQTLDDAAGEAFDKAAKLLGLGYPGGPKIDRIAKKALGASELIPFPKGHPREGVSALAGLPADLCVSFSGLKTALLRHVQQHPELLSPPADAPTLEYAEGQSVTREVARVVASYQEAIVQAVADRTRRVLGRRKCRSLILGGGVSLNSRLRDVLSDVAARAGVELLMARPKYCGDNGAMIAGLAYYRRNITGEDAMRIDVAPSLEVG
ncbi:MAG: tRNA (adenosine(37)-N6)-threonylcarbamoyltransferase complex transferase subunit TsaD [Kiritimatiellae bacterium]|nr:tRNA (adenosine(37)-N6)-threonylcarbamoyltransferase complex transferase subunit TsaD [Kiritimatiellia bacterium]